MWNFNIIRDLNKGLRACGDQFASAINPHVFAHPTLLKAWIDAYSALRPLDPVFVTGLHDNGNVVVLPLVLLHQNWKNAFQNILVPIGYDDFDYHDPIFSKSLTDKNQFWTELLSFVEKEIVCDSIKICGITDSIAPRNLLWREGAICPNLNLDEIDTEEALMKFFKTSLRGDIRRQMRRLYEIGELTLTEYDSFDSIPVETFEAFMHNHRLRWPNTKKIPHLHENLLREGLKSGVTHFSVLRAGDQEVAWHLGYEHNGVYYYYMPCGNQQYLKHSPTKVHLFFLVRRAVEKGYKVFDHLRGEENYKDGWSNGFQHVHTLTLQSAAPTARLKSQLLRARKALLKK